MTKKEKIEKFIEKYNGYLITSLVCNEDVSKTYVAKFIKEHGGIPAQKGYPSGVRGVPNFPGTLCVSINDVVIHGIPNSKTIIKDGDVVSVDLVVLKNGYHGDAARTFLVGNCSKEAKELVAVTKQAFFEGLKMAKPGNRIGDISNAVETYVRSFGFNLVREFQGHGIGKEMHEEPGVPNIGKKGTGPRLQKGMALAIEPMITMGSPQIGMMPDRWTVKTTDGKCAAHFEHTIAIHHGKADILSSFEEIEKIEGKLY